MGPGDGRGVCCEHHVQVQQVRGIMALSRPCFRGAAGDQWIVW